MIKALGDLLRRIFSRFLPDPTPPAEEADHQCALPGDLEIYSDLPHDDVPHIASTSQVASFRAGDDVATAQAATGNEAVAGCRLTIRPELGIVNIRLGPGLNFEPPLAKTQGGVTFELVGASEPDANELRWYAVKVGNRSGWIRGDLVRISQECLGYSFINPVDLIPVSMPPPPDGRFPLPVSARITQGYRVPAHPGFDMASSTGTTLIAPTDGLCIRRIDCTRCTPQRPNRQPNHLFQCPDTWNDPGWGFGYGNFIVILHNYASLPQPLRQEMDRQGLRSGFAYILYAHLERIDVRLGQQIRTGMRLGTTGNTGCSTAPHLHFEVRIGKDTNIDNVWSMQRPVHPRLIFDTP